MKALGMRALEWYCPECEVLVVPPNKLALALLEAAGACHKCRLAKTVGHLVETGQVALLDDVLRFTEGYTGFRVTI